MTEMQDIPPQAPPTQSPPPDDDTFLSKPPSSRSHVPSVETIRSWLLLYLKQTDSTISHVSRILSSTSATDSLLCTLQYSTLATSTLLSTPQLRRRLLSSAAPQLVLTLLRLSQSLKALSALISDHRTFTRLAGLLGLYSWAKRLTSAAPPATAAVGAGAVLARIAWAQVGVNVACQVLENGAFLSSKGVLGWDAPKQTRAWLWSSRFWMAHIALDLARLAYLWSERSRARARAGTKGKAKTAAGDELVVAADDDTDLDGGAWRRDLLSNAAYAPLTVHWSLEEGVVGDFWIGVLGTVGGGVGFIQLWKNTA